MMDHHYQPKHLLGVYKDCRHWPRLASFPVLFRTRQTYSSRRILDGVTEKHRTSQHELSKDFADFRRRPSFSPRIRLQKKTNPYTFRASLGLIR